MEIQILQLVEGARQARGIIVVIDVFRAFSTACYVIGKGAEMIIAVGEVETAFKLKEEHPEYILMGERNEIMIPGFDDTNAVHLATVTPLLGMYSFSGSRREGTVIADRDAEN